jgi:heterodisulfide reductase subunit A2
VRFEEIFPTMECAPCLLEPILGEILHGNLPGSIGLRLTSRVESVKGFLGNFDVRIATAPRHVSVGDCVGCGMCVEECPVSVPNPLNLGRSTRKAIDFELFGGLPSAPVLDETACPRYAGTSVDPEADFATAGSGGAADVAAAGADCTACRDSCPVDDTVLFDEAAQVTEQKVGAIVVAVGADRYDLGKVPNLGYGRHPDVLSRLDLERVLSANGPTGGELTTADGRAPERIAIVHCAGSLDERHVPYCSAICCQNAFKYAHLIATKLPEARVTSFYRAIVAPGKEAFTAYQHLLHNPNASLLRYDHPEEIEVATGGGTLAVVRRDASGEQRHEVDLVVLLEPVVASATARELARILDVAVDPTGFLASHNARSDATRATVRGVYVDGGCQAPMDIASAMTQGAAAAGHVLSVLGEGRRLVVDPATAEVDVGRCSGCRTCVRVCPYRAIDFDAERRTASVNSALCSGCGTCVAACPSGAIAGHHFTDDAIFAEIGAVLTS